MTKEDKNGIGTGFWYEGFGEIEIRFFPDDEEQFLTVEKCYSINKKALACMEKIYQAIEDPSLLEDEK